MKCPKCNISMFVAERPIGKSMCQEFVFCPKCKYEELGNTYPGEIHIEGDYYVVVSIPEKITVTQIKTIRKYSEKLRNLSASSAYHELKNISEYRIGPLNFYGEAKVIIEVLEHVGIYSYSMYEEGKGAFVLGVSIDE